MSDPRTENAQALQDQPTPKGKILKAAREEKGLSLQTVHEATKIPMDALRGIEEGYKVRNLSTFYYRSFMKIYANYLDVDLAQVLDDYKKEMLPRHIEREPVFDFDLGEGLDKIFTKQRKRQILYVMAALAALFMLFKIIGFLMSHKPAEKEPPSSQVEETAIEELMPPVSSAVKENKRAKESAASVVAVVEAVGESQTTQAASIGKNVVLTVRAKKSSWLRVKSDGVVVFQSTLNAGEAETWEADNEIEITGRNITQLEFELNGKLIGSLGRSSRGAKGLLVTQEGLSVTK
ncbi:MAG TPA: RodZ domain-containing protein [Candidatus Omnitrophota bacterium]|nr:RodZ domain-containing protein [Candidatus Omnitrophota bacterium]